MLEVCIDSVESAKNAVYNGADELEVCSCLSLGGLTPSPGLVKQVVKVIDKYMEDLPGLIKLTGLIKRPKVNVMIRCRAGADFCYTDLDTEIMLDDIDVLKGLGVDRFVFGCLNDMQQIEDVHCIKVLAQAYPTPVTFHRAFDLCREPIAALEEIIQLGFDRVLTSGQRARAADREAVALIQSLLELYGERIDIMPGAGINASNARTFINLGCKIIHSSCKVLKPLVKIDDDLGMGDLQYTYIADGSIVREVKKIISC